MRMCMYGCGMVQAMLRWLRELPTLTIPASVSISMMDEIKIAVTQETFQGGVIKDGEPKRTGWTRLIHSLWKVG